MLNHFKQIGLIKNSYLTFGCEAKYVTFASHPFYYLYLLYYTEIAYNLLEGFL